MQAKQKQIQDFRIMPYPSRKFRILRKKLLEEGFVQNGFVSRTSLGYIGQIDFKQRKEEFDLILRISVMLGQARINSAVMVIPAPEALELLVRAFPNLNHEYRIGEIGQMIQTAKGEEVAGNYFAYLEFAGLAEGTQIISKFIQNAGKLSASLKRLTEDKEYGEGCEMQNDVRVMMLRLDNELARNMELIENIATHSK